MERLELHRVVGSNPQGSPGIGWTHVQAPVLLLAADRWMKSIFLWVLLTCSTKLAGVMGMKRFIH